MVNVYATMFILWLPKGISVCSSAASASSFQYSCESKAAANDQASLAWNGRSRQFCEITTTKIIRQYLLL